MGNESAEAAEGTKPPLFSVIDRLELGIDGLSAAVNRLENQLGPVMVMSEPEPGTPEQPGTYVEDHSQVYQRLTGFENYIDCIVDRITALRGRLEV